MATLHRFLGVGDEVRLGTSVGTSISIPTKQLLLGQEMGFLKTIEVIKGYTSISSITLRILLTGTGNLYLKFGCSHTAQASGSTPTEDVDTYTVYAVTGTAGNFFNITVPASAYNSLTSMVAGDTLSISVYRGADDVTDTYTTDLEVVGFNVLFSTGADAETSTGDRSKKILGKIVNTVSGAVGRHPKLEFNIPETLIYDIMGDYVTKMAQEFHCLETSSTLTVSSSAASEPTGFLKFKQIELDTDLYIQPKEIDVKDYDILQRRDYTDPIQTPLYYKRWNGTITFFPAVTSDSYTAYWYTLPTTTPSATVDPETPAQYDKAIEYGAISEVAVMAGRNDLAGLYLKRYEEEMDRIASNRGLSITADLEVAYNGKNQYIRPILEH
jgi:hypothetical protein